MIFKCSKEILSALAFTMLVHAPARAAADAASSVISYVDDAFLQKRPALAWGTDPFLKTPGFGTNNSGENRFLLQAIISDKKRPAAMINSQVVRAGSKLPGGAEVTEIGPNYVLIQEGASLRELTLGAPENGSSSSDTDVREEEE